MKEIEEYHEEQQANLIQDLNDTSKKNTAKGSVMSVCSRASSKLLDYANVTLQERVIAAESKLHAAALQLQLAASHETMGVVYKPDQVADLFRADMTMHNGDSISKKSAGDQLNRLNEANINNKTIITQLGRR